MSYFFVVGDSNAPDTWDIREWTEKTSLDYTHVSPPLESEKECRAWILAMLKRKRNELGKVMEKWYSWNYLKRKEQNG